MRKFYKWLYAHYNLNDIAKGYYVNKKGGQTYTINQLVKIYEETPAGIL